MEGIELVGDDAALVRDDLAKIVVGGVAKREHLPLQGCACPEGGFGSAQIALFFGFALSTFDLLHSLDNFGHFPLVWAKIKAIVEVLHRQQIGVDRILGRDEGVASGGFEFIVWAGYDGRLQGDDAVREIALKNLGGKQEWPALIINFVGDSDHGYQAQACDRSANEHGEDQDTGAESELCFEFQVSP
jgi:hypothetical protein